MKKIKGAITTLVGIALIVIGAVFACQTFGTAMLNSSSKLGFVLLCTAPALLLAGMILTLIGTGKLVVFYKSMPKDKSIIKSALNKVKTVSKKVVPVKTPNKSSFIFCGKCGAKNNVNDTFCGNCGERLL